MSTGSVIDTDDYLQLTLEQRYALDEWLSSIGGKPTITRELRFFDGYIIAEEYCLDGKQLMYDTKAKDVITRQVKYKFSEPAPIWTSNY